MRRALRLTLLALPCCALIAGASLFLVDAGHPALTKAGTETRFKAQPFTGLLYRFHSNYRLALLTTYWNGEPHGWDLSWFANGQRASRRHFQRGVYDGLTESWYESGRIKSHRRYLQGLADGEQWVWGPEGQVIEYNVYDRDREITHKTWTFDGRPFHNYVYQEGEKVGLMGEGFCKRLR